MQLRDVKHWWAVFQRTGAVCDAKRSGRPKKWSKAHLVKMVELSREGPRGKAAKDISKALRDTEGPSLAPRTVARALRQAGLKYARDMPEPLVKPATAKARVAWARRRRSFPWRRVIFTDSKIFRGTPTADAVKKHKRWRPEGVPTRVPCTKYAEYQVHAYGGLSFFGATSLHLVTGTTGKESAYLYKTGSRAGTPHRGVASEEYRDVLLTGGYGQGVGLLDEAAGIFLNADGGEDRAWWWQQDGAKCHRVGVSVAQDVTHVLEWPAGSPDLSLIEDAWAETERILHDEFTWIDQASFIEAIRGAWEKATSKRKWRERLWAGMRERVREVVRLQGRPLP